ncbi:MAG: hypothetical protein M1812_000350 [Candelaria pacifica]|nr:MAG: hypothetical protein M1812_000350 [Candelaria pacifica]
MTAPQDIPKVLKNTAELTYDTFLRDILTSLGKSSSALDKWKPLHSSDNTVGSSTDRPIKDIGHVGERLLHQHLLPGKELDVLQTTIMNDIHDSLSWDRVSWDPSVLSSVKSKQLSLMDWTRGVLIAAATHAFFGNCLLEIDPNLFHSFAAFEASSWKLNFGYPWILSRDMHAAKDTLISAFTQYLELPKEERRGSSSLINSLENEMRQLAISAKDIATIILPVYWVINANTYKLCFWMMAYILYDCTLLNELRQEISPTLEGSTTGLECRLEQHCPRLKAVYYEVLRLTASTSTIRNVLHPINLGEKTLRRGVSILIPYRQFHMNESIFGKEPQKFDPKRFLDNNLNKDPCFRPFGGGRTYCPGRILAQREILTFVALAIHRFDLNLCGEGKKHGSMVRGALPRFPRIDKQKVCLGIMEPIRGDDLTIMVRKQEV